MDTIAGSSDVNEIEAINTSNPIRLAFFGGAKSGKTSIISKLTNDNFRDTYYPTHQISPTLTMFTPVSFLSRLMLDETEMKEQLKHITQLDSIILSPVIYQALSKIAKQRPRLTEGQDVVINSKNQYYVSYNNREEISPGSYTVPNISPIYVELIDTPSFNPAKVVPFLEASLYIKLDKDVLRNLANEPRRPASANPLLVASGASELNGNIDGYFFVYSAVPSSSPPSYEEIIETNTEQSRRKSSTSIDTTFNLLTIIKDALDDAWKEYNTFRIKFERGQEHDIFSFKSALKNMWKEKNLYDMETMRQQLRKDIRLVENSMNPADPGCPPPIWIVCTHSKSPLKSPNLIEDGIKLSKIWKCGFIAIDNDDDNIDEVLALMIREIVERKKLRKSKKR